MNDAESIYPNYWQLWKTSGMIEEKAGNLEAAAADWKRAFDITPTVAAEMQIDRINALIQKQTATTRAKH